jgi:hypothetical protein
MKTICETIGVARSNVTARAAGRTPEPLPAYPYQLTAAVV